MLTRLESGVKLRPMGRLGGYIVGLIFTGDAFVRAEGANGGHFAGGDGFSPSPGLGGSASKGSALGRLVVWLAIHHPIFTLLAASACLYFIYRVILARQGSMFARGGRITSTRLSSESSADRLKDISKIRIADSGYDEAAFVKRASGAFLAIHDAWSRQDMRRARAFISDGVFERFSRQITEYGQRERLDRMASVEIRDAKVLRYRRGQHYDAVFVSFTASAINESVALRINKVVSSTPTFFTEVWTFLRRPGVKTRKSPGFIEGNCPSCGAPLSIVDAAQCVACKARINSGEYDWVLVEITPSNGWKFFGRDRDIPGWPALSAADPGLSLETLEDRATVAFWQWLDARRRGGLDFEQEVVVGSVIVAACEKSVGKDRVHVRVRWEADRYERRDEGEPAFIERSQREHVFMFERRAGALSDPKTGLHAPDNGPMSWAIANVVPAAMWIGPG